MMGMFDLTSTALEASKRCDFQLAYERAPTPRRLVPSEISGDPIANAWGPDPETGDDRASGEWDNGGETPAWSGVTGGEPRDDVTVDEWIDHYASMAVNEAVHEALEWFRVDGKPWLDPHGIQESVIYDLVNELVRNLEKLRHDTLKR